MTQARPDAPRSTSVLARFAALCGFGGAGLASLGVLGIQLGLLSPFVGFRLFLLGAAIGGLLALAVGAIGFIAARRVANSDARRDALLGLAFGAGLVAVIVVGALPGAGLPAINDITTNLDDPPRFTAAGEAPANRGRDMGYPQDFVPQVREAYPDLAPIAVEAPVDAAFGRAVAAGESLGWEITFRDASAGVFEARDVTAIFRFVDDVRVRVRPTPSGSLVDVRSKSRDGRGDVGANAARIRAFAEALEATP
ncbi:MAG: DUF1499 domain-containing protein [Myxococcota bacterium]